MTKRHANRTGVTRRIGEGRVVLADPAFDGA
jgi:hypothetical protein